MRAGFFPTQLNMSDIACVIHDLSVGLYEGSTRLSSRACLEQDIPILDKENHKSTYFSQGAL